MPGLSFLELLQNPLDATGPVQWVSHGVGNMGLIKGRAPAHEIHRGVAPDLLLVAQRNISATSVLLDLGFGWREVFCAAPRATYVVPADAVAKWRLDADSQATYLSIPNAEAAVLLEQFGIGQVGDCLWALASSGFDEPLIHDLLDRLWQEIAGSGDNPLLSSSVKVVVLHALSRRFTGISRNTMRSRARLGAHQLRRVLAAIYDCGPLAPISVGALADLVGLSAPHFMRLFKNSTGKSPYRYFEEARLEKAKELLACGRLDITEVARRLGFASPSHFSRSFRGLAGCSPREYRYSAQR